MARNLVLNVQGGVGRMNVIMQLRSRGGAKGGRRVNPMMRMKRGVWVVKRERRFLGRRVGWKIGAHKDKASILRFRFSVCMY
jgi:hypothetical protein